MPLVVDTGTLAVDDCASLEVHGHSPVAHVEPKHGIDGHIVVHALALGRVFALGQVVVLEVATQPQAPLATVPQAPLAVDHHIEGLAARHTLHLAPVEIELGVACTTLILDQGTAHVGLVIGHRVAPQVARGALHQEGTGKLPHGHVPAVDSAGMAVLVVHDWKHLVAVEIVVERLKPGDTALEQVHVGRVAAQHQAQLRADAGEEKRLVGPSLIATLTVVEERVEVDTPHQLLCRSSRDGKQ